MIFPHTRILLILLFILGGLMPLQAADDKFNLTAEQEARLGKYMPRTFAKLQKKVPVHVVSVGDSVMHMFGYAPESNNTLKAWQSILLSQFSDQFYYQGGVRVIKPANGHPAKLADIMGVEITLQNLARGGKLMLHAPPALQAVGFENNPDLLIVSYGINDSTANYDPVAYKAHLQSVIDLARSNKADVLLFGPTLVANDAPEESLAATRPYADAMREVAEKNGVFFADLGDLSWLVNLKEVNRAITKDKSAPADGAARASLVQNPVARDLDPDPEKKAARLFDYIVEAYRLRFNHGEIVDYVHPDASFQRALGRRAFAELLNGPKAVPWQAGKAEAVLGSEGHGVMTFIITNSSKETQSYTLLPLVTNSWRPQAAPTALELKPGKSAPVSITYTRTSRNAGVSSPSEDFLRLPLMIASGDQVRIDTVQAQIKPISVLWNAGTTYNVEGSINLPVQVKNNSGKAVKGRWLATWMGHEWGDALEVAANGESKIPLKFTLPAAGSPDRQRGTLGFKVVLEGATLAFDREIELVRNIGLKQIVPLVDNKDFPVNKVEALPVPGAEVPGVAFRADADDKVFYLTWDIYGINLKERPDGTGAIAIEASLDARAYGKRLLPGTVEPIRVSANAADGDGKVSAITPWAFGTGYGMYFNEKALKCRLTSRPDGSRRLTLSMPRSYFYQHEWNLKNGNSQLGMNVVFYIFETAADGTESFVPYSLNGPGNHRDDAQSLSVLELTDKPTARWTVRMW